MPEEKRNIIHQRPEEYDIQTAENIQDALKDLLGYEKSERSDNDDYRNSYKRKRVNSSYGSMEIEVPQERRSTFQPQVIKNARKITGMRFPERYSTAESLASGHL